MGYIVKSSLDIGGKIIAWNEKEAERLIKEKEEKFTKKQKVIEKATKEPIKQTIEEKREKGFKNISKKNRRKDKAGEE